MKIVLKFLKKFLEKNPPINGVSGNYYELTGKFPGMSNSKKKIFGKIWWELWNVLSLSKISSICQNQNLSLLRVSLLK